MAEEKETVVKSGKEEKPEKKKSKSDKPSLGFKIKKFFKDYKSELKKIVWYGKKQTLKSTGLVIVSLVIVSAVIGLLDLGLNRLVMWIGTLV